jgi:hypothetical protein
MSVLGSESQSLPQEVGQGSESCLESLYEGEKLLLSDPNFLRVNLGYLLFQQTNYIMRNAGSAANEAWSQMSIMTELLKGRKPEEVITSENIGRFRKSIKDIGNSYLRLCESVTGQTVYFMNSVGLVPIFTKLTEIRQGVVLAFMIMEAGAQVEVWHQSETLAMNLNNDYPKRAIEEQLTNYEFYKSAKDVAFAKASEFEAQLAREEE